MISAVRHNFLLKVFSLFLAILGWAYFRFANNPVIAARFDQQVSVPITVANLNAGLIARFSEKTAVATIQLKRGEAPIKPDEVKAVLDLSNRGPGVYNVPVVPVAPSVTVQSLVPASITLSIERIDRKVVPVAMHYGGQANVVVSRFMLTPSSVTLTGPTSQLAAVATVRVEMPLEGNQNSVNEMVRPIPVDSSGNEIADLQVVPNLVRVQAEFLPAVKGR